MKTVPHLPANPGPLPARIIVTGKNSEIPKLHKMLAGYGADGVEIYVHSDSPVCRTCQGQGRVYYEAGFAPWQTAGWEKCEDCDGTGCDSTDDEESEA